MTSSLRRKHPTTRRNTRRWSKVIFTTALLAVAAASPAWAQSETTPADKPGVTQKSGSVDRLRQRNASDRWRELKQQPRSKLIEEPSDKVAAQPAQNAPRAQAVSDPTEYRPLEKQAAEDQPAAVAETAELPMRSELPGSERITQSIPEEAALPEPDGPPPVRARANQRPARNAMKNAVQDSTRKVPVREVGEIDPIPQEQDLIRTPKDLKRLTAIVPFLDYEPDPTLKDQCNNLCPRPNIGNCPECKNRRADEVGADELACPDCPEEVRLGSDPYLGRAFPGLAYNWVASDLYHYPLYFQDVPLERYGHTRPFYIQPLVSVPKFLLQGVFLPYQSVIYPPCKKQYALGHYRPGDCVPYLYYPVPISAKAALVEAAAITGGLYLYAPP